MYIGILYPFGKLEIILIEVSVPVWRLQSLENATKLYSFIFYWINIYLVQYTFDEIDAELLIINLWLPDILHWDGLST